MKRLLAVIFALLLALNASAVLPDVNVVKPNGGELISQANGSYKIEFNVRDADNNALMANIYYSTAAGAQQNPVVTLLDLEGSACSDSDGNNATANSCIYYWDTTGINGNFFIDVNVSDGSGTARDSSNASFTVDNAAPVATSISINSGATLTDSNRATLTLAATGASRMSFSCDAWSWSPWELYFTTKTNWNLETRPGCSYGEGKKTVYFRAADDANNVSNIVNDDINFDSVPPRIENIFPGDSSFDNNASLKISARILDNVADVNTATIVVSVNDTNYLFPANMTFDASTKTLAFSNPTAFQNGQRVNVTITARDNVGKLAGRQWSFSIDQNAAATITSLGARQQGTSILLEWSAPDYNGAGIWYYKVYRHTAQFNDADRNSHLLYSNITATRFVDATAIAGQTYYYRVSSVDLASNESLLGSYAIISASRAASLVADYNRIGIGRNNSANAVLTVSNNTDARQCLNLSADTNSFDLDVEVASQDFCLNPREQTTATVTITAHNDAQQASATVEVKNDYAGRRESVFITVEILPQLPDIELLPFTKSLCKGQPWDYSSALIRNNSNNTQTVRLSAHSEALLPSFEPSTIELSPGEEKYAQLKASTNNSTRLGIYDLMVAAKTADYYLVTTTKVKVAECGEEKEKLFGIVADTNCLRVPADESIKIIFGLKNVSSGMQTVRMLTVSDLDERLSSRLATVAVDATEHFDINVIVPAGAMQGKHYIALTASNDNYSDRREFCIDVNEAQELVAIQLNNDLNIERKGKAVFGFAVKNNSDTAKTVAVSVEGLPNNVSASLSETSIALNSGEERRVFATVNVSEPAALGKATARARFSTASASVYKDINFTVVEKSGPTEQKENIIEFLTYPSEIRLKQGETKNISIIIRNPTTEKISGLTLNFSGLPAKVYGLTVSGISLDANSMKAFQGTITALDNAGLGTTDASIGISNSAYRTARQSRIVVERSAAAEETKGFLAGMVGFLSAFWPGILVLIVIGIILLVISAISGRSQRKQIWVGLKRAQ